MSSELLQSFEMKSVLSELQSVVTLASERALVLQENVAMACQELLQTRVHRFTPRTGKHHVHRLQTDSRSAARFVDPYKQDSEMTVREDKIRSAGCPRRGL